MKVIKFCLSLITVALILPPLNAQISQGGLPYSFTHTVSASEGAHYE